MNHRAALTLSTSLLVAFAVCGSTVYAAENPRDLGDCGTAAVYALLQLEGKPRSFEAIDAKLSPPRAAGHSMKELRDAAGAFGLVLDGLYIAKKAESIDRPMLAFLKVDRKGHFLVVRPVGHTGKLVQVIDSNQATRVMEKAELVASDQWTGLVLAPRRTNWPITATIGLIVQAAIGGVVLAFVRRRRSREQRVPLLDKASGGNAPGSVNPD